MTTISHQMPFWAAAIPTIVAVIVIRFVSFGRDSQ